MKWRRAAAFVLDVAVHTLLAGAIVFIIESLFPSAFVVPDPLSDLRGPLNEVPLFTATSPLVIGFGLIVKIVSELFFPQTIGSSLMGLRVHVRRPLRRFALKYFIVTVALLALIMHGLLELIGLPIEFLVSNGYLIGYALLGLEWLLLVLAALFFMHAIVAILIGQRPVGDYLTDTTVEYTSPAYTIPDLPTPLRHYALATPFIAALFGLFDAVLTKLLLTLSTVSGLFAGLLAYQWVVSSVALLVIGWLYTKLTS